MLIAKIIAFVDRLKIEVLNSEQKHRILAAA